MTDSWDDTPNARERAALARFDAEVEAELPSEEDTMHANPFLNRNTLAYAASLLVMLAGLVPALLGLLDRDEETPTPPRTAEEVTQEKTARRVAFLVGLPDDPNETLSISFEPYQKGRIASYGFGSDHADAQRNAALAEARANPLSSLRATSLYVLKDAAGKELPVYWLPYHPLLTAEKLGVPLEKVEAAYVAAALGRKHDDLIRGRWVHADPNYFATGRKATSGGGAIGVGGGAGGGSGTATGGSISSAGGGGGGGAAGGSIGARSLAFTEACIASASAGTTRDGKRCVDVTLHRHLWGDFEDYTSRWVGRPLCLVVDQQIWMEPILREPISGPLQISGGSSGFTREQVAHLLDALGFPPKAETDGDAPTPTDPGRRRK